MSPSRWRSSGCRAASASSAGTWTRRRRPSIARCCRQQKDKQVDRRNIGHMHIPGIFFLESMFSPAGSGSEKGNREGTQEYRNCQFMTPETRSTTHFFWTYLNNWEGDDPNISRSLHQSLIEGFMEDKHLIEAQQVLDEDPEFKMLAVGTRRCRTSAGPSTSWWPSAPKRPRSRPPSPRRSPIKAPHQAGMNA